MNPALAVEGGSAGSALRRNEMEVGKQLAGFVRSIAVPIVVTDVIGSPLEWNRAASLLLGWPSAAQDNGTVHPTFVQGEPRWFLRLRAKALTGEYTAASLLRRRKGSVSKRILVKAQAWTDARATFLIFTLLDRTRARSRGDWRQSSDVPPQDGRVIASDPQSQKMEAIGRLAGGIAHDFNHLLTAIQGHAQLLIEDLGASETSYDDALEIKRAADRAAVLTRQLLVFTRTQALQHQLLDLNVVVRGMEKMLRQVMRNDVIFETHLAADLLPVRADASQMEQVLMNLVMNARDAMPSGGVLSVYTQNIGISSQQTHGAAINNGRYTHLVVSDTGLGMTEEIQSRIFEPFFTTKPEGEGTGLGLATVYGIVQQSGGSIQVQSEPGRGTTFRIILPVPDDAPSRSSTNER